jgi:choline/glycine/proline betaine transport protein
MEARKEGAWARLTAHMQPAVFFGSAAIVVLFVVFGGLFTDYAAMIFESTQKGVSRYFGWYYVLVVTGLLGLAFVFLISPIRYIRLGGEDAKPEFSRIGWFSMLFAAGMGIGLVYFGVAEPLLHFASPLESEPESGAAVLEAMRLTYFHWGLHAWGIYIVLALAIAHAHYNRNLPLAPRSVLEPLIGERMHGPIGHGTDILCTVGTLLGVATSLGLGAMQINASLAAFFGWPEDLWVQVMLIAGITGIAVISVVSGVRRGVQALSQANFYLMFALLLFVLLAGPTLYVIELFVSSLGSYLQQLPRMSLYLDPGPDSGWQTTWTLFYWGWWISWSPFVAIFIARISRGRTIREFILAVLLVPVLVTFLWLSVFGGTAMQIESSGEGAGLVAAVDENISQSVQVLLSQLPLSEVTTVVATLVILLFFVTSSDSGSLVDDMVTSGGDPHPPRAQRVFWAVSEGAVAATLLLLGGLTAIRNAAISLGLPMSVLLIAASIALWRTLRADPAAQRRRRGRRRPAPSSGKAG